MTVVTLRIKTDVFFAWGWGVSVSVSWIDFAELKNTTTTSGLLITYAPVI